MYMATIIHNAGQEISCLSHSKEGIAIGTTNGEVKILSDDNLTKLHHLKDEQVWVLID